MASGFVVRGVKWDFTEKQRELLDKIDDPEFHEVINRLIGEKLNQFVPVKTGALRNSMKATKSRIRWGNKDVKYAHYQWAGIVYEPNIPITQNGEIVGFFTPKGTEKWPSDPIRYLQYTDPMAESEWTDLDLLTQRDYDEISADITRLLKRKLRR